jgi:hypothetical protein
VANKYFRCEVLRCAAEGLRAVRGREEALLAQPEIGHADVAFVRE